MTRKLVSLLVAVLMVMVLVPMGALAAERENTAGERSELDDALNVTGGTLVFTNDATYPWTAVTEDGRTYGQSGNAGVSSSTSAISTTVTAVEGDVLQFEYKAWGEGTGGEVGVDTIWDKCKVTVDGETVLLAGQLQNDWTMFTYALAAGEHTIEWSYSKDSSVSKPGDYFAVDNVYVGQPVQAETITVDAVEVPAGRRATVAYTVLPENAVDKSVTFEIADTSVATVDANGVVTGVSEGTTTITVTSTAVPTVSGTATVTVTEAIPAVVLYGFATYDAGSTYNKHWVSFEEWDPSVVTDLGQTMIDNTAIDSYAAAYLDGNIYFTHNTTGNLYSVTLEDVTTPTLIAEAVIPTNFRAVSMTATNDTLYALVKNTVTGSTEEPYIATIDPETGALTTVGIIPSDEYYVVAIDSDSEGNGYALAYEIDDEGYADGYVNLCELDLETCELTVIGSTDVDANYVQDFCYDEDSETFYWAQIYTTTDCGLYAIDPDDGSAEFLGMIGGRCIEVVGMFTIPSETPVEPEPTEPVGPATNLDEALNVPGGTLTFTTSEQYPWVIMPEDNPYYAQSSNAGHASTTSTLTTTVTAVEGDIVQFDFKAWGEGSYSTWWDECAFSVDGTMVMSYGAYDNDWETFAYELTAGEHTLTWSYTKDSSVDPTGDYFAVDNVYVGQPVAVESIEADAEITVAMNRTATINYTVLPAEAFNKEVTFTSADETIATVNASGVVAGVAEGDTTVTIASVENPAITATVTVHVVDMGFTLVELYGLSVYDLGGVYTDQVVHFNDADPATIIDAHSFGYTSYAAAFAGGNVYGYLYGDSGADQRFYIMDAETYAVSFTGVSSPDGVFAMAYDYSSDTMYGIGGTGDRGIVTINLATGAVTEVATVTGMANSPMTLAIDADGVAYTIEYQSGDLYTIDLETGAATLVGATGVAMAYVQSMTYDFANEQIYWAQILDADNADLYVIDPATAAVTNLGPIGGAGMEICGLYIENDIEIAPIEMPDVTVTFVDGADNSIIGTLTVEAGTVLAEDDFPEAPEHEGLIFIGWDYDGSAVYTDTTITARYQDPNATIWDFETDPIAQGWQFVDNDGDGYNWNWRCGEEWSDFYYHEGLGYIMSESYDNNYGALYPNNSAFTPEFTVGENGAISFWAQGQDPSYVAEVIGVFVNGTQIGSDIVLTATDTQYTFNLSAYAGQTIRVEIRHYNVTDMFQANVDYVEVSGAGGSEPEPTPTPTPEPPAEVVWGDADGDGELTLQDALMIMRYALELVDDINTELCDVNGDGEINMADALLVLRKVMGIIDGFPVE